MMSGCNQNSRGMYRLFGVSFLPEEGGVKHKGCLRLRAKGDELVQGEVEEAVLYEWLDKIFG